MRRGIDAHGDPARLLDRYVERHPLDAAIGGDLGPAHRLAVEHDLYGDLARLADPGALEVPVRFLRQWPAMDRLGFVRDLRFQKRRHLGRDFHRGRPVELELSTRLAQRDIVDLEVDRVAASVADVRPALLDPFTPEIKVELAVGELDVNTSQPDALAVNAGEVGFTGNLGAVPAIERVVPDVELPGGRRVDRSR